MNCLSAIPRVLLPLLIAPVLPATASGADTPAVGPTPQATMLPPTWRLNYPTVPVRWWTIRQAAFNVDIDVLSRGFRLNIRLYPTNSSLNTPFPKGELSARLLEASGGAWAPTDDGLLDTPFSLESGPPQDTALQGELVAQSRPDPYRRADRFAFGTIPTDLGARWCTIVVTAGEDRYLLRVPRSVYAHGRGALSVER